MNHRRWVKVVVGGAMLFAALALTVALLLDWRGQEAPAGPRSVPTNADSLVLITVDTTRADRLEPYDAGAVPTPSLLALARNGILFEQAQATAPITLVAHTSILTGDFPLRHGVRNNGTHYVADEAVTLAEVLRDRGLRTAAFVSAAVLETRYGLDQGFEVYDDDLSTGTERRPRVVPDRPAQATIDAATAWLDQLEDDEDYFLWVHLYDPHASYSPPPPYRDTYRDNLYDGEIAYMDDQIGRLLRQPRIAKDQPLIAVVGDHGESLGEHGEQTHAILAYQSTMRIPFILRVPGGPTGLRVGAPVSQVDFMPTVLELLGERVPASVHDGRSLLPLLQGAPTPPSRPLYGETYLPYYTYGWAKLRSIRLGNWKYIESPNPELFDLRRDPREVSNQLDNEPGLTHDLATMLSDMLQQSGGGDLEAAIQLDEESAEKLRSLGYLAVGSGAVAAQSERADPKEMIVHHVGLERARQLVQDGLYDAAIRELRTVLRHDPANLAALIEISGALEQTGQLDEAVEAAKRALEHDPGYPRLHLILAGIESRRGRLPEALTLIDVALGLDPKHREGRVQKALVLRRSQRTDEAVALLQQALVEEPDDPQFNVHYARIAEAGRGRLAEAEQRLQKAVRDDPFLGLGWLALGQVQEELAKYDEAERSYRSGLDKRPDGAELHGHLGMLLARRGGGPETEVHLKEAIRLMREPRPDHAVALGAWMAEQGRFREAEAIYERVLADNPRHAGARNNRAIALYRTGRLDEAESEFLALLEDHPSHPDALNNLAAIAIDQEQYLRALDRARNALSQYPDMPEALNNAGLALTGLDRTAEALERFREALAADSRYWPARFNLGRILTSRGNPQAAAAAFEEVIAEMPWHAESHLALGDLYRGPLSTGSDSREKAQAHYNAFLRRAPTHPRAAEVRALATELALGNG